MSNYAASVERKTGRSHLFLSRGPGKGTSVFCKVGGKFSFPISCSFSFLVLTQDLPHSWHRTATSVIKSPLPQENTEFWARGTRKRGPLLSKECEEIPLFSLCFPISFILRAALVSRNCRKSTRGKHSILLTEELGKNRPL